jgi:hypothetical protein
MATNKTKRRFVSVAQINVPRGRNGKHKGIVSAILAELADLPEGEALKIPIAELGDTKENVRSALNRASHKLNCPLATAADTRFLYVWSTPSTGTKKSDSLKGTA